MVAVKTRGKVRAQLQINDFGIEETALSVGIDTDHGSIVLQVHGFGNLLLDPHAAFNICLRLIGSIHRLRFEVRDNALARNGSRETRSSSNSSTIVRRELGEAETVSAKILTFPKRQKAADPSIDEEIAELKAALNELVQPAPKVTAEERAAAAARPDEMERSGECARIFAEAEMDRQEREFVLAQREFLLAQCYADAERAYLEESLATLPECHCEVCEAGGNCCGGPFGWSIGELLAAAYDEDLPVTSISPKNRKLILKAASELAARLTV